MDSHTFLQSLAVVLCVAAVATVVFQRLRQPVVFGYLLAGLIIGPHIPIPLVADPQTVRALSELGVILLMFSLGLEFSLRKLVLVSQKAGAVALFECSVMISVGYLVGQMLGFTRIESVFAGAIVGISSTTIIVKAFQEQKVRCGRRGYESRGKEGEGVLARRVSASDQETRDRAERGSAVRGSARASVLAEEDTLARPTSEYPRTARPAKAPARNRHSNPPARRPTSAVSAYPVRI